MEQESNTNLFRDLELDNTGKQYISTMATWAKVIVIVTLVGYVASIVELIFFGVRRSEYYRFYYFHRGRFNHLLLSHPFFHPVA